MYSIVLYQCNNVYSHFECYEMDVLKYKIECGNKTKITFRLNKNSPISLMYLPGKKNRTYAKL